ncbi:sensor histidine kinase [Tepidibacter aestuarii]|uniref:sensor histidine kinase n=1 Tax=Tepidibacter aestuarii TaxID=2925782 RepID=UPI0020BFD7BA|nr:ATP-binding protein [Tepidibacter aestuarii]CAH2213587.1 Histidine kinase [Tepidibacter aestuarii]
MFSQKGCHFIDMNAVIEASQTISSEIELDKLLERLIKIVVENSCAEKGYFIMKSDDKFVIECEINHENISVMQSIPLEKYQDIPQSIVNYVIRTKENIVLDNASNELLFSTDPYIIRNQSKSILCMPIIYRGHLRGIGYLENNLSIGAFSKNHIEVLKILSTQAAISIENAVMYEKTKKNNQKLEKTVEKRTNDLKNTVKKLREEIKERKRVELELKESQEQYCLLVELLPDSVFVHIDSNIVFVNKAATKLFGAKKSEDLIGKSIKDFIHRDFHENFNERMNILQNNGNLLSFCDYKIIDLDGTIVNLEVASTPFPWNGKLMILSVVRDITERKQAESLRKSVKDKERLLKEALEYDRIKTQFITNISHELRTPLNVMLGAIQMFKLLLNDKPCESKTYKMMTYSDMMKQNCYRLIRLVNNLIDITKIDTGYFNINLKKCNIVKVIEDITLSVAEYVKDKDINLIFDTDVEEKIMPCDLDKMERILLNLLSNAIKFTDMNGSIYVNLEDKGSSIVISVKDTGIGISEDKQDMIFDRFIQVDKSLSRNREGSGIGLSLVKDFIELQGGTISLKSRLGYGSEFIIELPNKEIEENTLEEIAICNINKNREQIQIEFSDIYF